MLIYYLIKKIIHRIKSIVISYIRASSFQMRYPASRFHSGVNIDKLTVIGKYNVFFDNVVVIDSNIGDYTFIQKRSTIISASIGKFCSIASNVSIGLGQHPLEYVSTHPAFYSASQPIAKTFCETEAYSPFKKTSVGHDVWIGQGAMIQDGVNIGTGAVVAASAVVTRDVPDYAIVAGVPAKVIRYRFDSKTIRGLLSSQWWEKPEEWLKENNHLFIKPKDFLQSLKLDKNFSDTPKDLKKKKRQL